MSRRVILNPGNIYKAAVFSGVNKGQAIICFILIQEGDEGCYFCHRLRRGRSHGIWLQQCKSINGNAWGGCPGSGVPLVCDIVTVDNHK